MPQEEDFKTISTIGTWEQLVEIENRYTNPSEEWVFRGDSCERPLHSTLERLRKSQVDGSSNIRKLERELFGDFRRSFRIHASTQETQAKEDDVLYWLSLMRHLGTPTRFLDFTYSLFIAAFFALEKQKQSHAAVIWLVSKTWLTKHNVKAMFETRSEINGELSGEALCKSWGHREPAAFDAIIWNASSPFKGVFPVNPLAYHQRLHLQQGLFLCPVNVEKSFSDNLRAYDGHSDKVLKLLIRPDRRNQILLKLHRAGTNRELLFPGLDGFAQGLESKTPAIHSNLEELSANGARVKTDDTGEFLWSEYYKNYCL